jgi:TonB family protein
VKRASGVIAFVVLCAAQLPACSMKSWDANELVENDVVYSSNGRYCVVLRWYDGVADFGSERAGKVFRFDEPDREDDAKPVSETFTAALYEVTPKRPRLIREIAVERLAARVLVSDSGNYIVTLRHPGSNGCTRTNADDSLITIRRSDGTQVAALKAGDLFEAHDAWELYANTHETTFALRHESDTREVVVMTVESSERRVDLATGALLDEKRRIFPEPRVFITAASDPPKRPYEPASATCAAAFAARDLARLDPTPFFARIADAPLPSFPIIAYKARLRGTVRLEVLVSEKGTVTCSRHTALPFGLSDAAVEALQRWRFDPLTIDGDRVPFAGEVIFHFEDVLD